MLHKKSSLDQPHEQAYEQGLEVPRFSRIYEHQPQVIDHPYEGHYEDQMESFGEDSLEQWEVTSSDSFAYDDRLMQQVSIFFGKFCHRLFIHDIILIINL